MSYSEVGGDKFPPGHSHDFLAAGRFRGGFKCGVFPEVLGETWAQNTPGAFDWRSLFDVVPAKAPFVVRADFVVVETLGTRFNVKARGQNVEVACVTGQVRVKNHTVKNAAVLLAPGLATLVPRTGAPGQPFAFDTEQRISWTDGKFTYKSSPLSEVFAEIGRQFDVHLKLGDDLIGLTFSGRMKMQNLPAVLEMVCTASNLQYQILDENSYMIYTP